MKLIYLPLLSILLFHFFVNNSRYFVKVSKQEAAVLALQIRNYNLLDLEQKQSISKEIFIWENTEAVANITNKTRLPLSLVYVSSFPKEVNLIQPSPFKKRPVCWLPNLSLYYELIVVHDNMLKLYGEEKCPSVYQVMALLSHETYMRDIKGDNQLSTGMCQLYKPTAKYLTKKSKNKDLFNSLIYFDANQQHHFYSQKSMLEFVYHFLVLEKGYTRKKQKKGIKSYNGAGKMADNYAKNVLLKSMFYEALAYKLKKDEPTLALKSLKEWSKAPLKSTFIDFNGLQTTGQSSTDEEKKHLSSEEIKNFQRLKFGIVQYVCEIKTPLLAKKSYIIPDKKLTIRLESSFEKYHKRTPNYINRLNQDRRYFILEEDRSVYSYLKENTYHVLTRKNDYYFYTVEKKEKKELSSEKELQQALHNQQVVLSSASVGDTIYFDNYPIFNLK